MRQAQLASCSVTQRQRARAELPWQPGRTPHGASQPGPRPQRPSLSWFSKPRQAGRQAIVTWGQGRHHLLGRLVHQVSQLAVELLRKGNGGMAGRATDRASQSANPTSLGKHSAQASLLPKANQPTDQPTATRRPAWKKMTPRRTAPGGRGTGKRLYSSGSASPAGERWQASNEPFIAPQRQRCCGARGAPQGGAPNQRETPPGRWAAPMGACHGQPDTGKGQYAPSPSSFSKYCCIASTAGRFRPCCWNFSAMSS